MSLPWAVARSRAARAVDPVGAVVLPLATATGTVLAADALARSDLPATDTSAMDGWAVAGPPPWRVVGEVLAGSVPGGLAPGQAVRIATGAAMPHGATAVV
ncbi:MAG: molybdopterin biosynthesis protein, partial [Kineosporiaceae bacterium]